MAKGLKLLLVYEALSCKKAACKKAACKKAVWLPSSLKRLMLLVYAALSC